ncbi:FecCD family ABC transporter permease [Microbacterium gorillae]|uniref:FecCD family ABC transporter permease n=1 Tax=Microbacterium gorillae TaxID=1231063 RepID=UPI0005912860|nr:iron ABC transporter permease [Microbacterium gorillae]
MTTAAAIRTRGIALPQRIRLACVTATLALVFAVLASLALGTVQLAPDQVLLALVNPAAADPQTATVVWTLRMPRTLVAALVGAALATAGAVMQALLRNPLADPGVTGVSSGAAVGAVGGIVLGVGAGAAWGVTLMAFLGAVVVTLILQAVLVLRRDLGTTGIILTGVALSALGGALISLLIANAGDDALARNATFWLAGDLDLRTWTHVAVAAVPIIAGLVVLFLRRSALDALSLGEEIAATSGVDVRRERLFLLLITSLITGAAVSVSGVIAFVGLIVPHAVRLVVGAPHTRLLPLSALTGAVFLMLADTVARTAFTPAIVQTGVVCAMVGAPVFLFLLLKRRAS